MHDKGASTNLLAEDQLLTPDEAAHLLQVSVHTLAKWRSERSYELPYRKIGGQVRYRLSDVKNFRSDEAFTKNNNNNKQGA